MRARELAPVTRFTIPTPHSRPYDIVRTRDGSFWFEEGRANKIARITTQGQVTDEFPLPSPNSGAHAITASPDHGIWFTEIFANKIASIATQEGSHRRFRQSGNGVRKPTPADERVPDGRATGGQSDG